MQLNAIDRRTVATLLTELAGNNGPTVANHVRASLSALFSWAMKEALAESNPVIGSNKAVTKGTRDRVLSDDELRLIWNALPSSDYGDIVRLLALLGLRRDEVGGLRWSEVNFDKALISLPAERTKNGRPHDVPLPPAALAVLKNRPRIGGEFVFGSGANGFFGWSGHKAALDTAITLPDWRLHDLRRTVSTKMHDELGVLPHIVEAVLNHVSGHKAGVAGTYNRAVYAKEKTIALARWAEHLSAIVTGRSSKVVAIKGTAR